RQYGYSVIEAMNGDDAIRRLLDYPDPIHLLLTDVVMPGRSGIELVEFITARDVEIRVLVMSGYTDEAVIRDGIVGSGWHFIQKPFGMGDLARKVREVLDAPPPGARQ
ncbi:MAG: Blue-light-activated protein, partial [Armatimonadetes bacterium]|nr:Blue-light-activated protein [Armatimonadota bacterium]